MVEISDAELKTLENLREAASPLRGAGFEFIAILSIGAARNSAPDADALRTLSDRIRTCAVALACDLSRVRGFPSTVMGKFIKEQSNCLTHATRLADWCADWTERVKATGTFEAEEVNRMATFMNETMRPAAHGFIETLFTLSEQINTARLTSQRESALAMIGQINKLGAQINLIAINATIEAARAGDAGKGFAVIAAEIQELSKKSRSAVETLEARL